MYIITYLVGGIPTPLKNMKVHWDDIMPNTWKIEMFQTTNQFKFIFQPKKCLTKCTKSLTNHQQF